MAYEKKEYKESDAYNSAYSDTITELVGKVSNGEKFNYNPLTDQAYQSYASQYKRLGNEARQNTLSDVAINTGGLASSYATTAASQAQNVYDQALTDKIPELEALAYEKYNNERNYNLNALSSLQTLEDSAYSKFTDNRDYQRGKFEYDQNFDYQNYRDDVADQQFQTTFDYQKERDSVADKQWSKEYDLDLKNYKLNKQQQEWSQKFQKHQDTWQRMYNKWTTMGYANKQVAKYFGIKQGTKTSDQKYKDAQIALSYAQLNKSSGGGSGGSGGGSGSSGGSSGSSKSKPMSYKRMSKTAQDLSTRIAKSLMQNKALPAKDYYKVTDNWLRTLVSYYNSGKITKSEYNSLKSTL